MQRIKQSPTSFWWYVAKHSVLAVFNAKETRDSIRDFFLKSIMTLLVGFGAVGFLGWRGLIAGLGNNALTYLIGFASGFVLKVFSNAGVISANLYFEQRSISDQFSWSDVYCTVWKEPVSSPLLVGVQIARTEKHSVQNLQAFLHSVVKDGQFHFQGYGQAQLPIRKPAGVIAWSKSFSHEKSRNILLATLGDGKVIIRIREGQTEREMRLDGGTYDVQIGFTADGGVAGHLFRGLLISDGKSIDLRKL